MYELQCRSTERPWLTVPAKLDKVADGCEAKPLILHMQENRSHLSEEARICFSAIGLLLVVTSIAPALHGYWLVPAFSIVAMATLTFALERHGKTSPATETLEVADHYVRHCDSAGCQTELPAHWLKLTTESRNPNEMRLFLRGREGIIEFGRCLSLDERRELAPLVEAALAQKRAG